MNKNYDVIVIGAGNGGLSAATYLAKAGKKVLVVEKESCPGGCATSIRRGRFEFEATLHELCQMGNGDNKENAVGRVRKLLESYALQVNWVPVNEAFRSIVTDHKEGFDVALPVGVEEFCEGMEKAVPGSGEKIKAVLEFGKMVSDAVEWLAKHDNEPKGLAKVEMLLKYGDLMKTVPVSTDEMLDRFGLDQKTKHIFESYWDYISASSDEMSFAVYAFMVYTYVTQKPWIAKMRSTEISLAFDKAIRDLGGDIWYKTEVKKIKVSDGQVKGVKLSTGEEIDCNFVMSNVMPDVVFSRLIDDANVPKREKKLSNARTLGQHPFTIYLGLDIPYEKLPFKAYDTFVRSVGNTAVQFTNASGLDTHADYCVTVLNEALPDCSPEGTCMVQFSKFYHGNAFEDITAENYFEIKEKIARQTIEHFEKLIGFDIQKHIEEIVIATPMTWARYIGTPKGTVYGYMPSTWDGMFPRVESGHKLDYTVKGLRFCGGHGTNMDGYSQAYLSGAEMAKYMLEEM